tara:strand:- start:669 stop:905 length:237 start_codon:yes stop_codon:yes gene_type:complete
MKTIIELLNNELDAANEVQEQIGRGTDSMEEAFEANQLTAGQYDDLQDYWYERLYINDRVIESIEDRLTIARSSRMVG